MKRVRTSIETSPLVAFFEPTRAEVFSALDRDILEDEKKRFPNKDVANIYTYLVLRELGYET